MALGKEKHLDFSKETPRKKELETKLSNFEHTLSNEDTWGL